MQLDLVDRRDDAGLDVQVVVRARPVDQVEVDIVEAEQLEASVERAQSTVESVGVVGQLGGDEDLVPGQPGPRDRLAHSALVLVPGGAVDAAVTRLQGGADDPYGLG